MPDQPKAPTEKQIAAWERETQRICLERTPEQPEVRDVFRVTGGEIETAVDMMRAGAAAAAHAERDLDAFAAEWQDRFGFLASTNPGTSIESIDEVACILDAKRAEIERERDEARAEVEKLRSELAAVDYAIADRGVPDRDCTLSLPERVDNIIVDLKSWRHYYGEEVVVSEKLRAELASAREHGDARLRELRQWVSDAQRLSVSDCSAHWALANVMCQIDRLLAAPRPEPHPRKEGSR